MVPDHTLTRVIGRGAYGEVWLAANDVLGTYRAVKVIRRENFLEERPFHREFEGIQNFEPISRSHPGLVTVLHVGRSPDGSYFYYVMELADDVASGRTLAPASYAPLTLRELIRRAGGGRVPTARALEIGVTLASALRHLHGSGLVHRDIKPSNIILVEGQPKFADIGLVTTDLEASTHVGTPGYIAPEGPTSTAADVYSLGMVLYELFFGLPAHKFPELPVPVDAWSGDPVLLAVNGLILKACAASPAERYSSGEELWRGLMEVATPGGASRLSEPSSSATRPVEALVDPVRPPPPGRPLVCMIDDDPREADIFARVFSPDLEIITATRLKDAVSRLEASGRRPDLFVLDLYFPTGRDATPEERETMLHLRTEVEAAQRRLSEYLTSIGQDRAGGLRLLDQVQHEFRGVPAVFYTRKGTAEDVTACLQAGAMDVLRKPQPEVVDPGVDSYVQLEQASRAHRASLLDRIENLCSSRGLFAKLGRAASYLRKNWRRL